MRLLLHDGVLISSIAPPVKQEITAQHIIFPKGISANRSNEISNKKTSFINLPKTGSAETSKGKIINPMIPNPTRILNPICGVHRDQRSEETFD